MDINFGMERVLSFYFLLVKLSVKVNDFYIIIFLDMKQKVDQALGQFKQKPVFFMHFLGRVEQQNIRYYFYIRSPT